MTLNVKSIADYKSALSKSRIYRREILDKILELVERDEGLHNQARIVDWSVTGSIERQCEHLNQMLKILEHDAGI